jgi:hypothetical protein
MLAQKKQLKVIAELEDGLSQSKRDVSIKEQMTIVIRFVNKRGCVVE